MARKKKNDEEPIENKDNLNSDSDDTFGLPEVAYEPLKRDQEVPPVEQTPEPVTEPIAETVEEPVYEKPYENKVEQVENTYKEPAPQDDQQPDYSHTYAYMEQERSSQWPKILAIGLLVVLALGAIYYFAVYQPDQKEARAAEIRAAAKDREDAARRKKEIADKAIADAERKRMDSLNAIPKVGTIEVLSERTGQYFVVVASNIDDDLLTDYANKVIKTGKSVKIIPPFGKTGRYYRLAVDGKDSYADAQSAADAMKGGDFGDQLWVVKY